MTDIPLPPLLVYACYLSLQGCSVRHTLVASALVFTFLFCASVCFWVCEAIAITVGVIQVQVTIGNTVREVVEEGPESMEEVARTVSMDEETAVSTDEMAVSMDEMPVSMDEVAVNADEEALVGLDDDMDERILLAPEEEEEEDDENRSWRR